MSHLFKIFPALLMLLSLFPWHVHAATAEALPSAIGRYELSLSFAPGMESGRLTGTAKIEILPEARLSLAIPELTITGTLLRDETGQEKVILPAADVLILPPAPKNRTLFISYTKTVANNAGDLISPSGIALTGAWYPLPDQPMRYRLSAVLPDEFIAVTEADIFPLERQGNTVRASFDRPVSAIHFAAGPYTIHKRQVRENLFVYSLFFPEDEVLAEEYLEAAAGFLIRYEKEIGPFPYSHYVIAENRQPTGLGMPTFTLLGQAVVRLPFIKSTSLGHEIVHSWFGNAVEVDYAQGNWCEGLTAFLADHAFREDKGEGIADRQESITRYLSYVHEDTAIALKEFISGNHGQVMAEAKRAVGYDRGALLFHELRVRIGKDAFHRGIRSFFSENNGRRASWDDLKKSFATVAGEDLSRFFSERLTRRDIPDLAVKDIDIATGSAQPMLTFTLVQQTASPYSLTVPIRVHTMAGDQILTQRAEELETKVAIPLAERPLGFAVDPDHDFLRQLKDDEYPAVWSRFMGSEKQLAILGGEEDRELFRPLLDSALGGNLTIKTGDQVTDRELTDHDLLFLGAGQQRARALFGPPPADNPGFLLDIRHNPLNSDRVAALMASTGREESEAVAGRISHYGTYSALAFAGGRNTLKHKESVESGLRVTFEELPRGGATADLDTFAKIVDKLADAQATYIGETHTEWADHLLQLRLIEALYHRNPRLAIGMEMFPMAAQPALDQYIQGQGLDEKSFLKKSGYFDVWRYDWRYYRGILNFARNHHLPVIGLNLDRQIVTDVFRTGGTDSLSPEVRATLPQDRDLDIDDYAARLKEMHAVHAEGGHGNGGMAGFIQAQALWDETMAENVARFLREHPGYRMVVLAGSQHTRKDSGIPPRVSRRLPVRQTVVENISGEGSMLDLARRTDYYFFFSAADLPETPKIGVILSTEMRDGRPVLKVDRFTESSKAAEAGLEEGDVITEIGGTPVTDMSDVRIAMLDTHPADMIPVKVLRREGAEERTLEFRVELTVPQLSSHP